MTTLSLQAMRLFLSKSISSLNQNKLRGLLAENELRRYLATLALDDRVAPGGWVARKKGAGVFGHETVVLFPEVLTPGDDYGPGRQLPVPSHGLHSVCSKFHESAISAFYCTPTVGPDSDPESMTWRAVQLGLPTEQEYFPFPEYLDDRFGQRLRRYTHLRYHTDASQIPDDAVPAEFSKEALRVAFSQRHLAEISDVDGILWGQQFTYPLEIKEKTAAESNDLGEYFGLDIGPFVKLAFYAAKRGNLHSLFIVREVDESRELIQWWFITYDDLSKYASWVQRGGGTNMLGGTSSVVRIPKAEFKPLTRSNILRL